MPPQGRQTCVHRSRLPLSWGARSFSVCNHWRMITLAHLPVCSRQVSPQIAHEGVQLFRNVTGSVIITTADMLVQGRVLSPQHHHRKIKKARRRG
jgi:hypothetical protein